MSTFTIFSAFLQGLGIVAVAMRLHEMAIARCGSNTCSRVAASITFMAGVIVSMGFPLTFAPGVTFDLRHVFLIIAASYGGWMAALLTAGAAAGFRLWAGGAGVAAGLAGIGVSTLLGLMLASLNHRREIISLTKLGLLGLASSVSLATVFLLPWSFATQVFERIAVPFAAMNIFGVLIAGESLNRCRSQIVREKKLVRDTATDPLTGLANRRIFDLKGPELAYGGMRKQGQYAMMLIDIDNFKRINDTFGHVSGDRVLQRVCEIISANAREDDLVARYGGEEIVMVLPGCDEARTQSVAHRIRAGIETATIELDGIKLTVTVSIGYIVNRDPQKNFWQTFDDADAALYRAKSSGRNRVERGLAA